MDGIIVRVQLFLRFHFCWVVKVGRRFLALRFLDAHRQQVVFVPDANTHIIDQSAAAVTYYYVDDFEEKKLGFVRLANRLS